MSCSRGRWACGFDATAAALLLGVLVFAWSGSAAGFIATGGVLPAWRGSSTGMRCSRQLPLLGGRGSLRSNERQAQGVLSMVGRIDDEEDERPVTSGVVHSWEAGDVILMSGEKIKNVTIVYEVHGNINEDASNVILHPTSFGSNHENARYRIGRGEKYTLDTTEHAVVVVNLLGNGKSTSPSLDGSVANWKWPTMHDNAKLQKKLLEQELGVKGPLKMIFGYSMGAMCALQFGALYPQKVNRIAAVCGTAKTSHYNRAFLKSLRSALVADPAWDAENECYTKPPLAGMRTFGSIYAGWGLSPEFYREEEFLNEETGCVSLDDFLEDYIESFSEDDPLDLLAQVYTWDTADASNNDVYKGDLDAALAAIQAETWYIPCSTDRYFTKEDVEKEIKMQQGEGNANIEVHVLESTWGHRAGDPWRKGQQQQNIWLTKKVHELMRKGVSARV